MTQTTASTAAFDHFRANFGPAKSTPSELIRNDDELRPIAENDGLRIWVDGPSDTDAPPSKAPMLSKNDIAAAHLWAVREADVVHAEEHCDFGRNLQTGVLKHSNLTGGQPAFCAGELLFLSADTIVLNGRSGRYGPATDVEMSAIARAFRQSGFTTWSMGYDTDTDRPFPFLGKEPEWVTL